MRIRTVRTAALFAATIAAASSAFAGTIKLDPVHSMAVFRIAHLGASQPFGIFHGVEGTLVVDANLAPPSSMEITAHLAKLDMGNDAWEKHIKSPDFFDAAKFPDITFKSTSVKSTGDDTFEVTGNLSFHGKTIEKTITLKRLGIGTNPMTKATVIGYSTEFTVSRQAFGVAKYEGMVGDDVTLMVNLEGSPQ
jgi:polyisoprenoid-binding protein YceI